MSVSYLEESMHDDPLFYCGDDLQKAKLDRMRSAMRDRHLDAMLFVKHDAVRYVTGFYAKGYRPFLEIEYIAIVSADGPIVLGTGLNGEPTRAALRSRADEVRQLPKPRQWGPAIAEILSDLGLSRGAVGFDFLPQWIHADLEAGLPGLELVDAADVWTKVSSIKHAAEIDLIRTALKITQAGMRVALDHASRGGVSEIEVAAAAEYEMRRAGSEMTPFISLVASGYNAAMFERVATAKVIHPHEMVIIDLGCVFKGYTGDFARTTVCGAPTPEQRRLYRSARHAQQEAIKAVRPGVTCEAIDQIVRDVLRDEGYERYTMKWPAGHQLGYGLHGAPLIGPGVTDPLEAGMVINIEPAAWTPDREDIGGVEIEDTVLVTDDGYEMLTDFPYDAGLLEQ
jgi:Xaa-Pro aminopeptidase